ncbi:MAG: hypothetical protein HZA90_19685 [Verrucomicrobia bacterium]|nr:hypothetical protein [Verrucomicrobiota bacterium]
MKTYSLPTPSQPNRPWLWTLSAVLALAAAPPLTANDYVGSATCVTACHRANHVAHYNEVTNSIHAKMIRPNAHLPGVIHGDLRKTNAPVRPTSNDPTNDVHWVMGGWYKEESYIRVNHPGDPFPFTVTQFEWNPITGTYANNKSLRDWLTKCAGCHTTGYDPATRTFNELNIGCESCHGPGGDHVANDGEKSFIVIDRTDEGCGQCHIRAESVAMGSFTNREFNFPIGYVPGQPGTLQFIPEPLNATASFFSDGTSKRHRQQYLDVHYPGVRVTKHHAQGVSCVRCHNPHTAGTVTTYADALPTNTYGIKIYDNVNGTTNYAAWDGARLWHPTNHTPIAKQDLCKVCHNTVLDHHVHQFSAAALAANVTCTDCHMPDVINVDPVTRRGALAPHTFSAMLPVTSIQYGTTNQPNSCTYRCHQAQGANATARTAWADSIITHRVAPLVASSHPYQLRVVGTPNYQYALEASADFTNWVRLTTNTAAPLPAYPLRWGFEYTDPTSDAAQYRFYRTKQVVPAP